MDEPYQITCPATQQTLWQLEIAATGRVFALSPPDFKVKGAHLGLLTGMPYNSSETLREVFPGVVETVTRWRYEDDSDLALELVQRFALDNPVLRFRYRLVSEEPRYLSKPSGQEMLRYLSLTLPGGAGLKQVKEVRLSEFDEAIHSYRPTERLIPERAFEHDLAVMGPILVAEARDYALLLAYEHGSQAPDAFLHYALGSQHRVELRAVKGNYHDGQCIDPDHPFESLWFHILAVAGDESELAATYRDFLLDHLSPNTESRRPYIFYNTWNYQERNKWWHGETFLASMHQARILDEIDVAHRMGIDVFVIDTGWYEKTGDWRVNRERFPDGLKAVKDKLDGYGMKLGLWFSPREAAVSSRILNDHRDCLMAWNGEKRAPHPVWETEESQQLCLVSRYWEAFADELIRLNREVGVTYFKWDAIHQYGCNAAGHEHGTESNSPEERADRYAFELPRYMARVVDRVVAACPDAIVDFDVTEAQRAVGLGFLASGKYFLINNGPYYHSLDDPARTPGGGMGLNVFVFPGPARARLCRKPLAYDKWIPSILFLTHYLPDDPASSQMINLASLVLGQNGIWGDLLNISEAGIARFHEVLGLYKQVRDDVTRAGPVRAGIVGGSPEIHEKINPRTGRGLIAIFAEAPGTYTYVTQNVVAGGDKGMGDVQVTRDAQGRARLDAAFAQAGAALVFFGV